MAGLEPLISLIYHERQQPGSMLCAQHALNNLLRTHFSLDALEGSYHTDAAAGPSTNMDDTGFFSVQVLENALNVWGLNLVRWRSADMRPFQDRPHEQLGFILNLEQHWFTLRRFGQTASIGESHWFNLNSFLESPEWVSKTYLGMVLQQAETEGYSVFVITEEHEGAFPRTEADHLASTIREPSSASGARLSTSRTADPASKMEGFEDEDMELQAALQASLMGGAADELLVPEARTGATSDSGLGLQLGAGQSASIPLRGPARTGSTPGSGTRTPTSRMPGRFSGRTDEDEDLFGGVEEYGLGGGSADPVEASMARNRAIMERMQREQEMALRASYQEEDPEQQSQAAARRRQREEEEEEMLRRAIEESRALHEASTAARAQDRDDDDMEVEEVLPRVTSQAAPSWNPSEHRVYDDDDAELQAALRASLEQMPEGFQIPEESPAQHPDPSLSRTSQPPSAATAQHSSTAEGEDDSELESEADTSSVAETPAEEQLSMEEIRRRRLARFGG
ncbi:Josephin-domain-containing protein [Gloeophyllum trabeum ATCC 11539]|uniref:ubiquitinyl hydrolase 1 n=1 Tax=Gloeophyllum trabeum (strain ATCC 11539 / FP-39264 / Madison 617) TaxID=670483 RepID=S7RRF1_GLOTA|nr:Josephin-domain-containing protein [Gloeophyllum trabeum ATCC 11539]EPQ57220.1 Josephin-domain-containing protein [Gloeophyllum trabeum ATCC 11539]